MTQAKHPKSSASEASAKAHGPAGSKAEPSKTYQQTLDDALEDTFPASDPIAPGAAAHPLERAHHTDEDADWHLKPGSKLPKPKKT
ncbi:hypothetical protein [Burkholderia sp. L27(2015)]|uniref:hypothetical protein n=1 Tax=Burkholderia sp. L27(2015) TaxID=1641858 RepID=UPI00131CBC65|nr:hypothetical protein [Burkholderia sp. L27(2015)]